MRDRAGKPLSTILVVLILSISAGCRKNITSPAATGPMTLSAIAGNLITDGNFTQWDTHTGQLRDWNTMAAQKNIIEKTGNGLKISGNSIGAYYVYQRVSVDQGKFYKAAVTANYTIDNYFSAGLYVMDSSLTTILGKFERTYSSGTSDTWEAVFYTSTPAQVAITLGFLNSVNANVTFSNVALTEYQYQPDISNSAFSAHLNGKFPLVFTADQFDSTINKISDYVNSVLLCRYAYYQDTVELPILDAIIGSDTNYSYFNSYRNSLDQIQVGYCQKSSLSLAEILNNEFHIPVKQVHMVFGPEGKHQFQEYWNPFAGKWIAIDPCFNTRYIKNGVLAGVEEFDRSEAPQHMAYFGTHFYYTSNDYLVWFWQNMDNLMITDYYTITYPYTP